LERTIFMVFFYSVLFGSLDRRMACGLSRATTSLGAPQAVLDL